MSEIVKKSFVKYGRTYHLRIETAEDLLKVQQLDEALWVAIGAPVHMLNADEILLQHLDRNQGGRILTEEIKGAIDWLLKNLKNWQGIDARSKTLRLSDIRNEEPDGARIFRSVTKMIARLEEPAVGEITLEQIRAIKAKVEAQPVSEAGVVLPAATNDPDVAQFIRDIVKALGGVPHPSEEKGVNKEILEAFLDQTRKYLEWERGSRLEEGGTSSKIMPLGLGTAEAHKKMEAVRGKLDQYFAQCRAVALDERLLTRTFFDDECLKKLELVSVERVNEFLRDAPVSRARADQTLVFGEVVNPDYRESLETFRADVAEPLLNETLTNLGAAQWARIKDSFVVYDKWLSECPPNSVATLGVKALEAYLAPELEAAVRDLIAISQETAFVLDDIRLTEKLLLYQATLLDIVNNFVSFPHLYDPKSRAMFEQGTLVMDGRRFNLAVRVDDLPAHRKMASSSEMFVLYVEVMPGKKGAYKLAIPVTSGGKGNLCTGKHGVFQHVSGVEYDALVVDLIENPISILEAMVAPFKRIGALITGKIESFTTEATKGLEEETKKAVTEVKDTAGDLATGKPDPARKDTGAGKTSQSAQRATTAGNAAGMAAGWGVAIAALGSSLAYVTKTLSALSMQTVIGGIATAILAVVLPASIVTAIRLRRRDLSTILEGSGWAINARMRLTWSQSRYFSQSPAYQFGHPRLRTALSWLAALVGIVGLALIAQRACNQMESPAPDGTQTGQPVESAPDDGGG